MVTNSKRKINTTKPSTKDGKVLQMDMNKESSNVSVITKTTAPKVIIQSENVNRKQLDQINNKHLLLKLICFIIMCIILLITFFLSLKTYNSVNELTNYIYGIIQP